MKRCAICKKKLTGSYLTVVGLEPPEKEKYYCWKCGVFKSKESGKELTLLSMEDDNTININLTALKKENPDIRVIIK